MHLKKLYLLFGILGLLIVTYQLKAQPIKISNRNEIAGSSTFGENQVSFSLGYSYHWAIGKKQRLELGLGLRLTNVIGKKLSYTTAPANLARTQTIPFLIVFAGQSYENWDTLQVQRPLIFALNTTANIKYHISKKLNAGFNIDLLGISLGRNTSGILTSNGITKTEPLAKPASVNLLLTGDLDKGSLNSEAFLNYQINSRWGIRLVYQFLFTEYTTNNIFQIAPDGTQVSRFRNKANNFGIGISYSF